MSLETYRRKRNAQRLPGKISTGDAKTSKLPSFVSPQRATLVDSVPEGNEWLHEIKFDGYRILCQINEGQATWLTRAAHDWSARFGSMADVVRDLPVRQALLDGEVVALEATGKTNFQLLQNSLRQKSTANLVYFVFDLLYLDGRNLTGLGCGSEKKYLKRFYSGKSKPRTLTLQRTLDRPWRRAL